MNLSKAIGLSATPNTGPDKKLIQYINLKLAFIGCPIVPNGEDNEYIDLISDLLQHHQEADRLLADYLCPADRRIQDFLDGYLKAVNVCVKLPNRTFVLDRHGLARALSLPATGDEFVSDIVHSYRIRQGVLHNPRSDRRTTQGIFHVAEGGLPVPDDKVGVPPIAFANLLRLALDPPTELKQLPFTANQEDHSQCFVSLLLRPLVCPAVPGYIARKTMEIRCFAPGNLVSNLDFVESIFGNAGDPFLPENDAGLDAEHWTGHTGCVILAPHLVKATKQELGLPHWDGAAERQRRDGQCWKSAGELYNNGGAFKLTCRDERGVIVTIIADNYYGYCKKEVKTQISYAANLYGKSEEEHAGGALVFQSHDLGEKFSGNLHVRQLGHTFPEVVSLYGDIMDLKPEGYGIDKQFPDIIYVPEDVAFDLHRQTVSWPHAEGESSIKLLPGKTYVRPSGYKVRMEKPAGGRAWRLVGTLAEGTLCHKPCTVSGGGKSEISKPITDAILQGPVFVSNLSKDFEVVAELINRDYADRFSERYKAERASYGDSRSVLSQERSLGSVIKLFIPDSRHYTPQYNEWLLTMPQHIRELVFVVKRFYRREWGDNWREHFSVDIINGSPGNELKCDNRKLVSSYLRVGYEKDGAWRTFGLRKDFHPAAKISAEDDITASVVVPSAALSNLNPDYKQSAVKFVENCEYRLFQRPDDAIHRGYDKQAEADLSRPGNFLSNYEPLPAAQAHALMEDSIGFDEYTPPVQQLIQEVEKTRQPAYFALPSHPRLVDGKPSQNPRYLQTRPDLLDPGASYLAEMSIRMYRRIPLDEPIYMPVNAVLPGRRNNPPDAAAGVRSLAVFNPIHYLELPELFMEFISSMTGKSPSTTGAGSEGALTKGPFNALPPILDLNNAFVSYALTEYAGFITSAGYIGPHMRVDHDISLLVPEVWCRMTVQERDPQFLIRNGYLEKCEDFEHNGQTVHASRLGWRITRRFVRTYFGRVFNHPQAVFTDEMLRPERQDLDVCVDGINNIVETHQRVAEHYFNDGSIKQACPPLQALLHIMRSGQYEGKDLQHPDIRALFTRESLLGSEWYNERVTAQHCLDVKLWQRHISYLEDFMAQSHHADEAARLDIAGRLEQAKRTLEQLN